MGRGNDFRLTLPRLSGAKCAIEFFGLPGAGKSTLVDSVRKRFDLRTRDDLLASWAGLSMSRKSRYVLRGIGSRKCSLAALRLALSAPLTTADSLRRLALILAKHAWIRSQTQSLLLDENMLQSLWSTLYSARRCDLPPAALEPLLSCLYDVVNTHVVFVDVDVPSAATRVSHRRHGKSRFEGLSLPEIEECLQKGSQAVDSIVAAAAGCGMHVHRLDGSASEPQLVSDVGELISTIVAGPGCSRP